MNHTRVISLIARLTLTGFLLAGVYRETGPWTTLYLALIALAFELMWPAVIHILETLRSLPR